jgi:hypothetical protein
MLRARRGSEKEWRRWRVERKRENTTKLGEILCVYFCFYDCVFVSLRFCGVVLLYPCIIYNVDMTSSPNPASFENLLSVYS